MENENKDELEVVSNNESNRSFENSIFPNIQNKNFDNNEINEENNAEIQAQKITDVKNDVESKITSVNHEVVTSNTEVQETFQRIESQVEEEKNDKIVSIDNKPQPRIDVSSSNIGGINELLQDKKKFASFILFGLGTLISIIYLFKMNLSGLTLIYILLLCAGGAGITYFCYPTKNNSTVTFISLFILSLGFLLRVVQSSINLSIEYIIRYLTFFIGTILIFYTIYKSSNKNSKGLVTILLLIGVIDAVYLFFSLGSIGFSGYTWRLFLAGEALIATGLMVCNFEFDAFDNLNSTCKNVIGKLPKVTLVAIIAIILAGVLYAINYLSDESNSTYDPINGNNSGSILDNKNDTIIDSNDEEEEKEELQYSDIYKNNTTTIKTTYSYEEFEAEISLSDMYIIDKVVPPNPTQMFYTYYEASENKTYLVVIFNVKNIGAKTIDSNRIFKNFLGDHCTPTAIFDGKYEYTTGTVVGLDKDNDGEYDFDSYYYIKALETVKIYTIFEIADEVSDKPVVVNSCFGDVNLRIHN